MTYDEEKEEACCLIREFRDDYPAEYARLQTYMKGLWARQEYRHLSRLVRNKRAEYQP